MGLLLALRLAGTTPIIDFVMPALCGASTSFNVAESKTWMAGINPALTRIELAS
jgi:hypothetical protein